MWRHGDDRAITNRYAERTRRTPAGAIGKTAAQDNIGVPKW
jgi:hypothetical protein